jgi:glutamyl-tRNA reductase
MIKHQLIDYKNYSLVEREVYFKKIDQSFLSHSVVINTCNRLEIYNGSGKADIEIVQHLFELSAGLQSKLVGETAILGQIKESYLKACSKTKLSSELHRLFQQALHVGKLVRNKTGISRGAMSYSLATVQFINTLYKDISNKSFALIGVNALNDDILSFLTRKGAHTILIGNRSIEKAKKLGKKYNADIFRLSELKNMLSLTDVVISATSAPHPLIFSKDIPENKNLTIFDLAVPRDVAIEVSGLKNVALFNLEDIENKISTNILLRTKEVEKAYSLVNQEVEKFMDWQKKTQNYETLHSDSFAA